MEPGRAAGLLALEHREPRQAPVEEADLLERLGAPLALAIDNALSFQRLHVIGAEQERQRLAARLHDRFAQSLAYIAIELDRSTGRHPDDEQLGVLRDAVRATLSDLRDTLRDLRTAVTEERSLTAMLTEFVGRFGDRFGVAATFEHVGDDVRPPLPVEQQLLRITQDLLTLAQHGNAATGVAVVLETSPGRVRLSVTDDGRGIAESAMGAESRDLLAVIRERADAIGAGVGIRTDEGRGAVIDVTLRDML